MKKISIFSSIMALMFIFGACSKDLVKQVDESPLKVGVKASGELNAGFDPSGTYMTYGNQGEGYKGDAITTIQVVTSDVPDWNWKTVYNFYLKNGAGDEFLSFCGNYFSTGLGEVGLVEPLDADIAAIIGAFNYINNEFGSIDTWSGMYGELTSTEAKDNTKLIAQFAIWLILDPGFDVQINQPGCEGIVAAAKAAVANPATGNIGIYFLAGPDYPNDIEGLQPQIVPVIVPPEKPEKPDDPVISYCGEPTVVDFIAGQRYDAGTIIVGNDKENLYVTFTTKDGWKMKETHLYVGNVKPTQSAPGQLGNQHENLGGATVDTYTFPLSEFDGCLFIAAHADVGTETAWGAGDRIGDTGNWAMYFEYCIQECTDEPVPPTVYFHLDCGDEALGEIQLEQTGDCIPWDNLPPAIQDFLAGIDSNCSVYEWVNCSDGQPYVEGEVCNGIMVDTHLKLVVTPIPADQATLDAIQAIFDKYDSLKPFELLYTKDSWDKYEEAILAFRENYNPETITKCEAIDLLADLKKISAPKSVPSYSSVTATNAGNVPAILAGLDPKNGNAVYNDKKLGTTPFVVPNSNHFVFAQFTRAELEAGVALDFVVGNKYDIVGTGLVQLDGDNLVVTIDGAGTFGVIAFNQLPVFNNGNIHSQKEADLKKLGATTGFNHDNKTVVPCPAGNTIYLYIHCDPIQFFREK